MPDTNPRVDWLKTLIDKDNIEQWRTTGQRLRLFFKQPLRKQWRLNLVLLDTSASTLSGRGQMKAKGVIEALSAFSYLKRDHFSLVTFGNDEMKCVVPPQRAPKSITDQLNTIKAGGGTPLAQVIHYASALICRSVNRTSASRSDCHVYLLTDGRSTQTSTQTDMANLPDNVRVTVIDVESSAVRLRLGQRLANWLKAEYWHVDQFMKAS